MATKYEEPVNYFDMDLKGVYKLNKTAHLRLNLFIDRLEKQQEQSMIKLDHDIRETKRQIAKIEDEKNMLVMKLLKSYVRKTTQRKKKSTRFQESVINSQSGANTGFTFSTYLDVPGESTGTSEFHSPISRYKRPHSIHVYPSNVTKLNTVQEAKAYSEIAFPVRKHVSRDTERRDIHTRVSNLSEIQKRDIHTRISKYSDSQKRDIRSRVSSKRDIHSRISKASCVTELPATRCQTTGTSNSEYFHNQKVKEMLGGNTCLFRGHHPARGYNIEPMHQRERGFLPKVIHPDDQIEASKLLERIQVFGNVKLPNIIRHRKDESIAVEEDCSPLPTRRLLPTLPSILSSIQNNNKDGSSTKKK